MDIIRCKGWGKNPPHKYPLYQRKAVPVLWLTHPPQHEHTYTDGICPKCDVQLRKENGMKAKEEN